MGEGLLRDAGIHPAEQEFLAASLAFKHFSWDYQKVAQTWLKRRRAKQIEATSSVIRSQMWSGGNDPETRTSSRQPGLMPDGVQED